MTNSQRIEQLRSLDRTARRDLSERECCEVQRLDTAHERLMWAAGFRKGFAQALRGERTFRRAEVRSSRGKPGDKAWARGFHAGINYVPSEDAKPRKEKKSKQKRTKLTKREFRRLTRSTS